MKFPNIFYEKTIVEREGWLVWHKEFEKKNFKCYRAQLNFAVYVACVSSGITVSDFLKMEGLEQSIYVFHFYYWVHRVFTKLKITVPFSMNQFFFNDFDVSEYNKLCDILNIKKDDSLYYKKTSVVTKRFNVEQEYKNRVYEIDKYRHSSDAISDFISGDLDDKLNERVRLKEKLKKTM